MSIAANRRGPGGEGARVLCIGETMIMVHTADGAPLGSGGPLAMAVGGAESNVATHLSASGHAASWASLLGDDVLGDLVLSRLEDRGVETSLVGRRPLPTGLYVKSVGPEGTTPLYYRAGSAASTMDAALARTWARQISPEIVHVSGISAQLTDRTRSLLRAVCQERVFGDALVSFDVNHRPALAADDTPDELLRLARAADIVFVGADEAERVWGVVKDDIAGLIVGPRHLVVKDGAVDAVEHHGGVTHVRPAPRVDVVEAVGAGDAFAGGWLGAFLRGRSPGERLDAGHAAAGRVLGSHTDLPPAIDASATRREESP